LQTSEGDECPRAIMLDVVRADRFPAMPFWPAPIEDEAEGDAGLEESCEASRTASTDRKPRSLGPERLAAKARWPASFPSGMKADDRMMATKAEAEDWQRH